MKRTSGRVSLRLLLGLVLGAIVAIALGALLLAPIDWPRPPGGRPSLMQNPSISAEVDASALRSMAAATLAGPDGLPQYFGQGAAWWNPLQGRFTLREMTFPHQSDGAVVITAKADASLTNWLAFDLHVDQIELTLVPNIEKDGKRVTLVSRPVVTNLLVREFGDSRVGTRLNMLLASAMTGKAGPLGTRLDGLSLSVELKPEVSTVQFGFKDVVMGVAGDSIVIGAGPVVKTQPAVPASAAIR